MLQDKRFVRSNDPKPVDVDVRILAASSDNLDRALAEKRLDRDLYYRLSAFTVHVPPLRQRKEEIKFLLRYTMHKIAKYYGLPAREFTQSALDACQNHSWPGNLKELETFVKRYLVAGDEEFSSGGFEVPSRINESRDALGSRSRRDQVGAVNIEIDDPERAMGNREKRNRSRSAENWMESKGSSPFIGCKLSFDSLQD